jgi:hypothetical protein
MRQFLSMTALLLLFTVSLAAQETELGKALRQVDGLIDLIEFSRPSSSATVRYANNQVATHNFGSASATWFWPNGQAMTNNARSSSATWFWPNGKMMTTQIGSSSATWWWPDGQTMSLRGPGFSAAELEKTPALAARVLRLAVRNGY